MHYWRSLLGWLPPWGRGLLKRVLPVAILAVAIGGVMMTGRPKQDQLARETWADPKYAAVMKEIRGQHLKVSTIVSTLDEAKQPGFVSVVGGLFVTIGFFCGAYYMVSRVTNRWF